MAVIPLDFVQPTDPDILKLHIYEAPTKEGSFSEIEVVTEIGTYPNYITRYVTSLANSVDNWFAIAWENSEGSISPLSASIKGNTTSLPFLVAQRVTLRDSSIDERVAVQEAESVLENYLNENPYESERELTFKELGGLTYLVLARVYFFEISKSSAGSDYVAGLVSERSSSSLTALNNVKEFLKMAQSLLGLNVSVIAQMAEIEIAGGVSVVSLDQSRLLLEIE